MNCPYCQADIIKCEYDSYHCIDVNHHFIYVDDISEANYLYVGNYQIGKSSVGYYFAIYNPKKDNQYLKINPYDYKDSYYLLLKYKKLLVFL
jgi:hypothetical protein